MILVFGSLNIDLVAQVPVITGPGRNVPAQSYAAHCCGKGAKSGRRCSSNTVAKFENRTAPKISRKLIFGLLYRTIRSLTSPNAKRINGPKKFRSSTKKDFFNTIRRERSLHNRSTCESPA
jgi:hypothetical protein